MLLILNAILFLLFSTISFALPNDSKEPIHITANSSIFNYKTGIDTYEGNVIIDQGTTHVKADRVVTEKNKQRKIMTAIAYGLVNSAEFSTLPKKGDAILTAKAKVIKFYPLTSIVMLEKDVFISQAENSFEGPAIVYNMKEQIVSAPPSTNGRSTIIIKSKHSFS